MFFLIIGLCDYPINQVQAVGELFTTPTSICSITRDLKLNMIGNDVKELQKYLNNDGFPLAQIGVGSKGHETTIFGSLTKDALAKFQKANKISATIGVFDLATRDFLGCAKPTVISPIVAAPAATIFQFTRDLKLNMIGNDVKELQKYLNNDGFPLAQTGVGSKGKETAFFGPITRNALIKFQKANKITPAVGFFGSITKKIVNKKVIEPTVKANPVTGSNTNTNSQTNNSSSAPTPPAIQNNNQPNNVSQSGDYSIGGGISGLSDAITLQNNGADYITINPGDNSSFTFPAKLANGANYNVSATSKYFGQTCYINNNIGVVNGTNITNVKVACGQNLNYNPNTFASSGGVTTYTLTYTANANGSITGTSPQSVNSGSSGSTITAVPSAGYSFSTWSDGVTTAARTDNSVTTNLSVTATFTANNNTITFDGNTNTGGATAEQTIATDATAALTTNGFTKTGYSFAGWATTSGGAVAYANGANYTIGAADVTLYAKWTINTFALTSSAGANGSITSSETINYGTDKTFTITPNLNYHVADVLVDSVSVGAVASYPFTNITAAHTISTSFTIDTFTLTYSANANGSITGTSLQTINYGANGTEVTATPNANYHWVNWSDAVGTAARTDTNITANKTVSATFALDTHTVTFNKNGGDTEASPTTRVADYNTTVTLPTAPTKTGYTFASWNTLANGLGTLFNASTAVTDDITVYAKWNLALAVGNSYQGGKIAYIFQAGNIGYVAGETHGIIAATADQSIDIWAITTYQSTSVPGGTSPDIGTGLANTNKIITQNGGSAPYTYAAGKARAYTDGTYHDWYLPSQDELNQLYLNQAVIGNFASYFYWSSSEISATTSWIQNFTDGKQYNNKKDGGGYVRAVRTF